MYFHVLVVRFAIVLCMRFVRFEDPCNSRRARELRQSLRQSSKVKAEKGVVKTEKGVVKTEKGVVQDEQDPCNPRRARELRQSLRQSSKEEKSSKAEQEQEPSLLDKLLARALERR